MSLEEENKELSSPSPERDEEDEEEIECEDCGGESKSGEMFILFGFMVVLAFSTLIAYSNIRIRALEKKNASIEAQIQSLRSDILYRETMKKYFFQISGDLK